MFLVSLETGGEGVLRGPVLAGFFCRLGGLGVYDATPHHVHVSL